MSSKISEFRVGKKDALILAVAAAISVGGYLLASHWLFRIGFPLDDSWIHQTYARNLALYGEWAFWLGQSSGGSTAPLWSAFLAIGYWVDASPYLWAFGLGAFLLWSIALLGETVVRWAISAYRSRFPWAGIFLAGEWHLVWAAASGMETLLYALLVTMVLTILITGKRSYLVLGVLIGVSVWVRPGGITLLGPVIVAALLSPESVTRRLRYLVDLALGFGILLAFYLFFNLAVTGTPWPNTFYAKQAEYAILLQRASVLTRFLAEIKLPLIGAGALLLPGALRYWQQALRKRDVGALVGVIWFLGYAALYAWRLPVTYQHGRYMMPAMPIFFIWGIMGTVELLSQVYSFRWRQNLGLVWKSSLALIWLAFFAIGAKAYAEDVAFIESEMVATARWVAENIPDDKLIAAHDIGALGYFAERELVDLAGLVSPEVIPFIRNEDKLAMHLDQREVDYLIAFPFWYENLTQGLPIVYNTGGYFAPSIGGDNMVVYNWTH